MNEEWSHCRYTLLPKLLVDVWKGYELTDNDRQLIEYVSDNISNSSSEIYQIVDGLSKMSYPTFGDMMNRIKTKHYPTRVGYDDDCVESFIDVDVIVVSELLVEELKKQNVENVFEFLKCEWAHEQIHDHVIDFILPVFNVFIENNDWNNLDSLFDFITDVDTGSDHPDFLLDNAEHFNKMYQSANPELADKILFKIKYWKDYFQYSDEEWKIDEPRKRLKTN